MCGIWTQKQWEDVTKVPGSKYSVVGRFQNAAGQTALLVKETYPDESYYWNIYSSDGNNHTFHYDQERAIGAMGKRGFTTALPLEATVQVDTAGVILVETTTTPETAATPDDGVVRVQGKTLAEWEEEGRLNNEREEHVHPSDPEGEPNEDEIAAFEASLSEDEKGFMEITTLVKALGGVSIF